jgi:hypothetical protein
MLIAFGGGVFGRKLGLDEVMRVKHDGGINGFIKRGRET